MPTARPLARLVLLAALVPGAGCAERQALEAERARLEGELLRRQTWLEAPSEAQELKTALTDAFAAAGASVPPLAFRPLGNLLASFEADGRLEEHPGSASRITLEGPGGPRRGAEVLAIVARMGPGIVVDELSLESERWRAIGTVLEAPTLVLLDDAAPRADVPVRWPWNGGLATSVATLDEKIRAADATLGFSPDRIDGAKVKLGAFLAAYESPGRLANLMRWVEPRGGDIARMTVKLVGGNAELDVTLAKEAPDMATVADFLDVGLETGALKIDGNHVTATLKALAP